MSNGTNRLFQVMKKTSESTNTTPSQVISLTVKSTQPLIFMRDDRLEITEEFCTFNRAVTPESLKVGDLITAFVFNGGQKYFIQQNNSQSGIGGNYNDLINKPFINGVELVGNMTAKQLGLATENQLKNYFPITGGTINGNVYIQGMLSHHYTAAFATPMWFYIGDFKFSRQGEFVELNGYYGDGQNGNPEQQVIFKLTMMKGFEGNENNIGLTVNFEQNYLSTMSFKINQTSKNDCSLYMWFPSNYPSLSYTVTGGAVSFTEKNEALSAEPVGTKWATIYYPMSTAGVTMSGPLNFASNTWNKVGDDVAIGDANVGGALCIKGLNDYTKIALFGPNNEGPLLIRYDHNGSALYVGEGYNMVYGNYLYSPDGAGIYFDRYGNIHNRRAGSEGGNFSINSDSTICSFDWYSGVSTFYYGISARSYISMANGGGTSWAGLCNASGVPIIRDHNNSNVTVDATGGQLFLGFQNTTGINILNGKSWFDSDGDLNVNIVVPKTDGSGSLGISSRKWGTGYVNTLYLNQLRGQDLTANIMTEDSSNIYWGTASSSSGVTTNVRGNTVRLYAHTSGVYLGSSGSTAVTSDENLKDIYEINDKYIDFFYKLKPVNYIYKKHGHRKHFGFGARQVEQALLDSGLTTEEFAGILIDKDVTISADEMRTEEDVHFDEIYSLRYEEFVSLNTLMIQKAFKELNENKNEINSLKEIIKELQDKINSLI